MGPWSVDLPVERPPTSSEALSQDVAHLLRGTGTGRLVHGFTAGPRRAEEAEQKRSIHGGFSLGLGPLGCVFQE